MCVGGQRCRVLAIPTFVDERAGLLVLRPAATNHESRRAEPVDGVAPQSARRLAANACVCGACRREPARLVDGWTDGRGADAPPIAALLPRDTSRQTLGHQAEAIATRVR